MEDIQDCVWVALLKIHRKLTEHSIPHIFIPGLDQNCDIPPPDLIKHEVNRVQLMENGISKLSGTEQNTFKLPTPCAHQPTLQTFLDAVC